MWDCLVPQRAGDQPVSAVATPAAAPRPRLIYDGDCAFCSYWALYWQKLTGDRVDYRPYQDVATQYPAIPIADFARAVQFIAADGARARAAEASFLALSHARGKGFWLTLYRRLPGFAFLSERAYAVIAAHRPGLFRLCRVLWGKDYAPPRHDVVAFLFLRLLALVYLAAFISFAVQAQGLIGSHGIVPLGVFVDAVGPPLGGLRFWVAPMVFWLDASDAAIAAVSWAGAGISLLLLANLLPRLSLVLLYALYLSLFYAGQVFMTFQWDTFLLETGFLALLLSLARTPGLWLLRWLLFRFMFMSGAVKLLSGDPNWWNLSALSFHFFTQPLPTPLAWYAAQLPLGLLRVATGAVFVIELGLPFLIFCPRRLRFAAAFGTVLLQLAILLTGNYNWFNLQTMLLCVLLFDDAALSRVVPRHFAAEARAYAADRPPRRALSVVVGAVALLLVFCSLVQMDQRFGGRPPALAQTVGALIEPLHIVNGYGLFAVMTIERREIVIQGSDDGVAWRDYEFRYKPGDVARAPGWNIPYQPRLDWQMWFAALDQPWRVPWFANFLQRLLENEPSVTALLEENPFPDQPPTYLRAQFYDYTYASAEEKAQGRWWNRRYLGLYFPTVHLERR